MIDNRLKLELPWPPSVNHYYANRVAGKRVIRYITARGKKFKQDVKHILTPHTELCKERYSKPNRLSLHIKAISPDRRRRDLDNLVKAVQDALEDAGAYEDDTQIDELLVYRNQDEIIKGGKLVITLDIIEE